MNEMTEEELEEEQANERLNGCCECGEIGHGCNDCPVFQKYDTIEEREEARYGYYEWEK
jgi:diphthamide synthase (EF-2-diphthine--ammonia ligase)